MVVVLLLALCGSLVAVDADERYVTALDEYQRAEVELHQGHRDQAIVHVRLAIAARDAAIEAYRPRLSDAQIQTRIDELRRLDRPCCNRQSLSERLGLSPTGP
jgi:hypothetical protein